MKRRCLDVFCGAGGATAGYQRAGYHVTGVDLAPQPRYCGEAFVQADALEFLARVRPGDYSLIHASPPCQRYARIGHVWGVRERHPDLIAAVREELVRIGTPYVIENVPDAARELRSPVVLCGSMFGLGAVGALDGVYRQLRRHRLFEASFLFFAPECHHGGEPVGVYGHGGPQRATRNRGYMGGRRERNEAMGIDWMKRDELSQAIPPAYTEWIGRQMLAQTQTAPAG